mmetsp:Transcript_4282/g.6515  ORF Transcript_4282/g.6515 Transcript_4282/m.6515 type:complete len:375 (+) Transcript_4282:1764-2888(+)
MICRGDSPREMPSSSYHPTSPFLSFGPPLLTFLPRLPLLLSPEPLPLPFRRFEDRSRDGEFAFLDVFFIFSPLSASSSSSSFPSSSSSTSSPPSSRSPSSDDSGSKSDSSSAPSSSCSDSSSISKSGSASESSICSKASSSSSYSFFTFAARSAAAVLAALGVLERRDIGAVAALFKLRRRELDLFDSGVLLEVEDWVLDLVTRERDFLAGRLTGSSKSSESFSASKSTFLLFFALDFLVDFLLALDLGLMGLSSSSSVPTSSIPSSSSLTSLIVAALFRFARELSSIFLSSPGSSSLSLFVLLDSRPLFLVLDICLCPDDAFFISLDDLVADGFETDVFEDFGRPLSFESFWIFLSIAAWEEGEYSSESHSSN